MLNTGNLNIKYIKITKKLTGYSCCLYVINKKFEKNEYLINS